MTDIHGKSLHPGDTVVLVGNCHPRAIYRRHTLVRFESTAQGWWVTLRNSAGVSLPGLNPLLEKLRGAEIPRFPTGGVIACGRMPATRPG